MNWELIIWLTGLMLFAYWLIYVFGSPLAEDLRHVDPTAFLAKVPRELAWRRLRKAKLAEDFWAELQETLAISKGRLARAAMRDWQRNVVDAGRSFFTWERALLCPICLHFWLTVLFGAVFLTFDLLHARQDWLLAGFTYLLNHFFIRKIS